MAVTVVMVKLGSSIKAKTLRILFLAILLIIACLFSDTVVHGLSRRFAAP